MAPLCDSLTFFGQESETPPLGTVAGCGGLGLRLPGIQVIAGISEKIDEMGDKRRDLAVRDEGHTLNATH